VTAEQPSVEALRERALTWLRGRRSDNAETEDIINGTVALTAALETSATIEKALNRMLGDAVARAERAERERDAGNEKHLVLWQRWQDAEARAQKAEAALTEILERPHGELDEHEMRSIAHAALTAYDKPPTGEGSVT
jgi:hypothetical protein